VIGLQVVRTVKIPVHYAVTKRKLSILDSLTAHTTHGAWLWSQIFKEHELKGSYGERRLFYEHVKEKAKLSGALAQCRFDTAAWMWKSYWEAYKAWRREVTITRRDGDRNRLRKLLRREPQEPFSRGVNGKVPTWFDGRIGSIERSRHLKLCPYVARVSTLRRGVKLTIPLNPARYHLNLLEQSILKSFQLVKRDGKYYVHVKMEFYVPTQPVHAVHGVDLGVKRSIASVMLRPHQPLRSSDFSIQTDGLKRDRLNRLEKRIAKLQQARKWEPLKRIRHKRLHISEYYDRLAAKQVAASSQNSLVVVGYPKGIKYDNARGNGKPWQRKHLARWTYGRTVQYIQQECAKQGIPSEASDELWSSRTCHRCGSRRTERLTQSIFHCWNCELIYNADYNAAINIGSRFLPKATTRQATDDLAYAGDEQAREIVSCEPRSPHPFMGGSKLPSSSATRYGRPNTLNKVESFLKPLDLCLQSGETGVHQLSQGILGSCDPLIDDPHYLRC
jgi:transposase